MPDATSIGWLIANFGIAIIALVLLDRSHRDAYKKLEEMYKAQLDNKALLIESLRRNVQLVDDQLAVKRGEHERI